MSELSPSSIYTDQHFLILSSTAMASKSFVLYHSLPLLLILLLSYTQSACALFTTSGPKYALSVEEGADGIVALNNLLSYHNGFNSSKWYDSGFAFARVEQVNGKRVAFRYVRFTKNCTVGTWESAMGDLVFEDFRTTVPYLRPFLLHGCSWAAVSNGYAWLDYYLLHDNEAKLPLPSLRMITITHLNESDTDNTLSEDSLSTSHGYPSLLRAKASESLSMVSRYSPVEKTGFLHCPVSPLVLLSHDYGVWDVLKAGEYLTSANKRVKVEMQRDCNLVLSDTLRNRRMWSSNTGGMRNTCFLRLQSDGNMVIYDGNVYNPVWATNEGCGSMCVKFSSLVVEDDGNLVVYRSQNSRLKAVWSTNTKLVQ